MTFHKIKQILEKYKFYGFTVHREKHILSYTFHSIAYYAVDIIVDTVKIEKEKIVTKVKIANILIDDEKELIPTLNGIYKIHKKILYGTTKI